MSLLIQDTARNNLASWTEEAVAAGWARGAVISPFTSPRNGGWKRPARDVVERMRAAGAEVFFDPETHALQMPAVGDFRYYDEWELWASQRGALNDEADFREHVRRVFGLQDDLGVPHLAPTMLLHSPQSATSQRVLELAQAAVEQDPACRVSIAGDSTFWAGDAALDAHIGALAQLEPGGWWLTVVRSLAVLPVPAMPVEIHGLCRTARALSEQAAVHISHGDLAGLPAIAAGAETLGTGWDPRQRACAYGSYAARDPDAEGGQWFTQATLAGLLSLLVRRDARILADRDPALATALLPGVVPPGPAEAWRHHAQVLSGLVAELGGPPEQAYARLRERYTNARGQWPAVAASLASANGMDAWVTPLLDGLEAFGRTEGF
jgi:hypothetical protein